MGTYYVSSSAGSDSGDGSRAAPWATLTHAVGATAAMDTILLRAGDTFGAEPSYPVTLTSYRTIGVYGSGTATIPAGAHLCALQSVNCGMSVAGLTLTSNALANYPGTWPNSNVGVIQAVVNDGAAHDDGLTISGCTVTGGVAGILLIVTDAAPSTSRFNHVSITGNTVSGCLLYGIATWSSNGSQVPDYYSDVSVSGNTVTNIPWCSNSNGGGFGIFMTRCNATVARNYITGNYVSRCGANAGGTAGGGPAGIFPGNVVGCTISGNVSRDNSYGTLAIDGCGLGIDFNCSDVLMERNVSINNQGAGFYLLAGSGYSGNTIRWNLSLFDNYGSQPNTGAVNVGGACTSTVIHNNTIISTGPHPALNVVSGCSVGKTIANNHLTTTGAEAIVFFNGTADASLVLDGNYYQAANAFRAVYNGANGAGGTAYTSLASWQAATGREASGVAGTLAPLRSIAPLPAFAPATLASLAAAYRPVPGGAVDGKGLDLLSLRGIDPGATDLSGATVRVPYAIGALATAQAYPSAYRAAAMADIPRILIPLTEPAGSAIAGDALGVFPPLSGGGVAFGVAALAPGLEGTALRCSGAASFGLSQASVVFGNTVTSLSMEAWFRPSAFPSPGNFASVFNGYDVAASTTDYNIQLAPAGEIRLVVNNSTGGTAVVAATTGLGLSTGATYHVVAALNTSTTFQLYVNGVDRTSLLTYSVQTGATSIKIRSAYVGNLNGGQYLTGDVQWCAVYPTALSAARVQAHYAAGIAAPAAARRTRWCPPRRHRHR